MDNRQSLKAQQLAAIQDTLNDSDTKWHLCRRTNLSYVDLLALIAEVKGSRTAFADRIGYSVRLLHRKTAQDDWGWWGAMCDWIRQYIPQWEHVFMDTVKNDLVSLDSKSILEVAAKALNIAPDVLIHFATHREEIELFLETQRKTLGTLAEAKLWELVMAGDAATVRWLLPRIKSEQFGDKLANVAGDNPRKIRIIEVEADECQT